MKFAAIATAALALACIQTAGPAAAQDATQNSAQQGTTGTEMEMEGELPEGSLAEKRAGAIGEQPDAVHQGGAHGDQSDAADAAEGEAPEGTLMQRREGTIGEDPDPVVQGGADKQ
jgi:hypothetical protein